MTFGGRQNRLSTPEKIHVPAKQGARRPRFKSAPRPPPTPACAQAATPALIKILTAAGPLSVNQDPLALQGQLCGHGPSGLWQAWAKPLAGGATALLLLNRNGSAALNATADFRACNVSQAATTVTDLWSGAALGSHASSWSAELAPHSHRLVKIAPPAATGPQLPGPNAV